MKLIGMQMDAAWEDPAANLAKLETMLQRAGEIERGSMIVLPEMFATGFTMNTAAATGAFEQTCKAVEALAGRYHSCIVAGIATPAPNGPENQAIVFSPAGRLASYTKIHPFSLGGEKQHYRAGESIVTFSWEQFTVAPLVCYDLRFPESFRAAAARGATLFVVPANWPISRAEHWLTLLRARAIENQAYVIGVNRAGRDPNTLYGGRSIIVDPMGVIRADAGDAEGVVSAEISSQFVVDTRKRFPFLQDMQDLSK